MRRLRTVDDDVGEDEAEEHSDRHAADHPRETGGHGAGALLAQPRQLLRRGRDVARQDGEEGDQQPVAEHDARDDRDGHRDLADRREVRLGQVRRVVAHEEHIGPIQDHAEDDERDREEEPAHRPAHRPVEEERERRDDADEDLDDERHRRAGVLEEVDLAAPDDQVADLHDRIGADEPGNDAGERRQQLHLGLAAEADVGVDRLEDHHREADHEGRQQEQQRQDGGVPERARLGAAISISVPSDDWCMHDRTTPATMKIGSTIFTDEWSAWIGFSSRCSSPAPGCLRRSGP